jgi:hypothetical protein
VIEGKTTLKEEVMIIMIGEGKKMIEEAVITLEEVIMIGEVIMITEEVKVEMAKDIRREIKTPGREIKTPGREIKTPGREMINAFNTLLSKVNEKI